MIPRDTNIEGRSRLKGYRCAHCSALSVPQPSQLVYAIGRMHIVKIISADDAVDATMLIRWFRRG